MGSNHSEFRIDIENNKIKIYDDTEKLIGSYIENSDYLINWKDKNEEITFKIPMDTLKEQIIKAKRGKLTRATIRLINVKLPFSGKEVYHIL